MNKYLNFEDLESFWNYAFRESNAWKKESRAYCNDWSGGVNWEQAKELATRGWLDGLKEVEKYTAQYTSFITENILRPNPYFAINGDHVDIGVFLTGDPECFVARELKISNSPGNIYKIVSSMAVSCAIQPETIIQRGAVICTLIDAIEASGSSVELISNCALSGSGKYRNGENKSFGWFEVDVKIKQAGQPLDMSTLAFCLAHPAMLRRIIFSVAEIAGWSDFANAYGYPAKASEKGDIYIEEIFSGVVSNRVALDWVRAQLLGIGITIEEEHRI